MGELGVDPHRVAFLGFSSGAHVAARATVFANATEAVANDLGINDAALRTQVHDLGLPNAVILACAACCLTTPMLARALSPEPVLTFETGGRGEALFGTDAAATRAQWSPELHVPASPPP